jgi:hypothetical protein
MATKNRHAVEMAIVTLDQIEQRIYEIRGQKVMLDRELADMQGVETRVLNQAVRRNIDRFPGDFMFQPNKDEFDNLISQIAISRFGLVEHEGDIKAYGAGLLSSFGELEHAFGDKVERRPFDLEQVINLEYTYGDMQPVLCVIPSYAELKEETRKYIESF